VNTNKSLRKDLNTPRYGSLVEDQLSWALWAVWVFINTRTVPS